MKNIRVPLPISLLALLLVFLFIVSGGSSAVYAAGSAGAVKADTSGTALLADQLPVSESQGVVEGGGNWTSLANIKQAVKQVNGGGHINGYIYIPGGMSNSIGPTIHNTMQSYEISTGRWRIESEPMPIAVADAAICTDNAGNIHVINGFDSSSTLQSSHQIYDASAPGGSRWSTASAPAVGGNNYFSQASGCAFIGRNLYLFGGLGNIGAGIPAPLGDTWAWNPMTDTWSDTGFPMNTARYWFGYGQKTNAAYVAGGTDDSGPAALVSTERFLPSSGWQSLMDLPVGLLAPGLVGVEAGPMVFGGGVWNGSSYTLQSTTYLCDGSCPPSASWNDVSINLNTARWFAGYAGGPPDGPYITGGVVTGNGALKTTERLQAP